MQETRPWRQWHSRAQFAHTTPLEVSAPKRPQWGRYLYLAIILLIAAVIAKVIFGHIFWYGATGIVSGQQYTVSSTHSATVEQVLVQPSEHVQAGQRLAKLNSPELQRELTQSKARLARLQQQAIVDPVASELASLRAKKQSLASKARSLRTRMAQQRQQINAMIQLIAQGAASGSGLAQLRAKRAKTHAEYDQAQANLAAARSRLSNIKQSKQASGGDHTQEHIATLKQEYKQLRTKLNGLALTAPASGQVAQIKVAKGTTLRPGDKAFVIVSSARQRAYLYFPPAAQGRLHKGQKLTVTGPDGAQIHVRISNIYPSLRDAPITAKRQQFDSPKVVVAAQPVKTETLPKAWHSGTPINSQIPRWELAAQWFDDLRQLF